MLLQLYRNAETLRLRISQPIFLLRPALTKYINTSKTTRTSVRLYLTTSMPGRMLHTIYFNKMNKLALFWPIKKGV